MGGSGSFWTPEAANHPGGICPLHGELLSCPVHGSHRDVTWYLAGQDTPPQPPPLKIGKERFPRFKILTGISLVPPLLLGPVGPKLDLASEYLRPLKKTPGRLTPPDILIYLVQAATGASGVLELPQVFISSVQASLRTALLDQNHAVNLHVGLPFGGWW